MATNETVDVGRFYTRSRRFPKLIGRMHDGTRIPGGPYTVPQAVIGVIAFVLANMTRSLWGTGTFLVDLLIAAGIGWGAMWLAGQIPATRRNLLSVIAGIIRIYTRPLEGSYRGATLRLGRPRYVDGGSRVAVESDQAATTPITRRAIEPAPVVPTMSPPRPVAQPQTAVQRLLEQANRK